MAYLKIDTEALRNWVKSQPISQTEILRGIGRSKSYFNTICKNGVIHDLAHSLLCKTYGLPDDAFLIKEPEPIPEPAAPVTREHLGYFVDLKVNPRTVDFTIKFAAAGVDVDVVHAYAKIIGNTELDIIKSISYAAHMAYKIAEQKQLSK